jgi:predicted RNase H-related nuclease YkuK (DUF458 family)
MIFIKTETHTSSTENEESEIIKNIINFIKNTEKSTKIYIGADSKNIRNHKKTQFIVAVVIHYSGSRGSKMFALSKTVPVIRSVNQRLLEEAFYAMEIALKLREEVGERFLSVHLDINPNPIHKSSGVIREAVGMISGQGLNFKIKPDALAATSAADYISNNPGMVKIINNF